MKDKYKNWIEANVKKVYGQCKDVTKDMAKAFPELKRVRGFYHCSWLSKKREHWWLVDKDKNIIDPTVRQFLSGGVGEYEEWIEGSKEPTGKCMNCGAYCYDHKNACSDSCGMILEKYINS